MKTLSIVTLVLGSTVSGDLPIDEVMEGFEKEYPEIAEYQERVLEDFSILGLPEEDWSDSYLTSAMAVTSAGGDVATHVLGEWKVGGHSAKISGDMPFTIPHAFSHYSVREHEGSAEYHTYYRLSGIPETIVIHYFGAKVQSGHPVCSDDGGMKVYASLPWEEWSKDTRLIAFAGIRASRDDMNVYCTVYEPTGSGGYYELSFNPERKPYLAVNEDSRIFEVTERMEAYKRIFEAPPLAVRPQAN